MTEPRHEYERRLFAAYAILYTNKPSSRGAQAWFRREVLSRTECATFTVKTASRWFGGEHPMPDHASNVMLQLEDEARAELLRLAATLGPGHKTKTWLAGKAANGTTTIRHGSKE